MKYFIVIALVAISFASCHMKFENSYTIVGVEHDGHDCITVIRTEATYFKGQLLTINGASFKVMWVNSTDLK